MFFFSYFKICYLKNNTKHIFCMSTLTRKVRARLVIEFENCCLKKCENCCLKSVVKKRVF